MVCRLPSSHRILDHAVLWSWITAPFTMMTRFMNSLRMSVVSVLFHTPLHELTSSNPCAGARLIYLPPYLPDFNPIEQAFSSVKAWLRRHEREALTPEMRPWLIHQAIMSVSPEDAEGWITNCGYS